MEWDRRYFADTYIFYEKIQIELIMEHQQVNTEQNINLIATVTNLLYEHGHPRPNDWERYLDKNAYAVKDAGAQYFFINRALRLIIGKVTNIDTIDIRYCLVENCKVEDWIRIFKKGVLPFLVNHTLPIQ